MACLMFSVLFLLLLLLLSVALDSITDPIDLPDAPLCILNRHSPVSLLLEQERSDFMHPAHAHEQAVTRESTAAVDVGRATYS